MKTNELKFDDSEFQINGVHVAPRVYEMVKQMEATGINIVNQDDYAKKKVVIARVKKALALASPDHEVVRRGYMKARSLRYELISKSKKQTT